MQYTEVVCDLFELRKHGYAFVQCISSDLEMGKGIAVQFNKYFNTKNQLVKKYGSFLPRWDDGSIPHGFCIREGIVYNLITKRNYWGKPTYQTLQSAIDSLKEQVIHEHTEKLAMPLIGCGLDRLEWDTVRKMLQDTFEDTDVKIVVCGLERTKDFPATECQKTKQEEEMEY